VYCIVSARQAYCYVALKEEKGGVSASAGERERCWRKRGERCQRKRGEGEKYERAEAGKAADGGQRCGEDWGEGQGRCGLVLKGFDSREMERSF
jgi:hypothetical protein